MSSVNTNSNNDYMKIQLKLITPLMLAFPLCGIASTNEVHDLGTIYVEASPISKYHVDEVSSSTYFNVPPTEFPVSVDVITTDFIREQNPVDLHELLFFQPGLSGGGKSMMDRTSGQYSIRGMAGSTPSLDGTLPMTGSMGMFLDPGMLERVEISKGPIGAVQGGQTSTLGPYGAGGAISLVQKQPRLGEEFTDVDIRTSVGSESQQYRMNADVHASGSESLGVRIPLGISLSKPFWLPSGHDWAHTVFAAPSLYWEPSDDLRISLSSTLQFTDAPGYQGVPSFRGKPMPPYNWDSYVAGDHDLRDEYTGYSLQGYIEWDATDVWQFRGGAGFAGSDMEFDHIGSSTYANQSGVPSVKEFDLNWRDTTSENYNLYGRSIARYDAFGASHTTLFQVDALRMNTHSRSANAVLLAPNLFSPLPKGDFIDSELDRFGILAQDYVEVGILRLIGGVRYDEHESNLGNSGDAVSPRVGVSILPAQWLAFFANYSRTESPNFGHMKSKTEELTSSWNAEQYETGVRISPVETLWLTLTVYEIKQNDTPSYDDSTGYYVTEGRSDNRGVEATLSGNVSENWSLSFGYSYNDAKPVSGGKAFDPYPPHSISLQTTYSIPGGLLNGLTLGAGYRFKHGYDGTMRGEYVSSDYYFDDVHVFDFSVQAPMSKFGLSGDWTLQLALKNAFNEEYFESNRHYYQCFTGEPRTVEIALRGRF